MSKVLAAIIIFVASIIPGIAFAAVQDITSTDYIEQAKALDGQEISYTGEVVGDIMKSGDHTWLNISDGSNAIGVWVEKDDMDGIDLAGRYNVHGDTVNIIGIFNRACPEHGGDLDIHAHSTAVIQKGYATPHMVEPIKVILSAFLLCAVAVLTIIFLKRKIKL